MGAAKSKPKGKPRGRPYAKGQSGNPAGYPKGRQAFVEACRARTVKALEVIDDAMERGDNKLPAAVKVLEWAWGKPSSAPEDREALMQTSRPLAAVSAQSLLRLLDETPDEPDDSGA